MFFSVLHWTFRFVLKCLGYALILALAMGIVFSPIGVVIWYATNEVDGFFICVGFGMVLGVLLGIGEVIVEQLRDPDYVREPTATDVGFSVAEFYAGELIGPWRRILRIIAWLVARDSSKGKPGRWKRGMVGASVGALLGICMAGAVWATVPQGPETLKFWQGALIFGGLGTLVLGVIGALSDAW